MIEGYRRYHALSDQANRARQVGFSMQLLTEFLRFYRFPHRARLFAAAGITNDQVVCDSALLWLERFHWWGHYERAVQFADRAPPILLRSPSAMTFWLAAATCWPSRCATAPSSMAMSSRPSKRAAACWKRCGHAPADTGRVLARARLATSIGWMLDTGGLLDSARRHYVEANAAF